ncbi:hypothetical protein, partial [Polynucleobacter sp. 35-46-11]|uniref:hypothetical protein n=1 Tax=Polynucleobacter sp. 35-46-11 TaxID=1970425 RepID=UPI0025D46F69
FKGMREWVLAFACASSNLSLFILRPKINPIELNLAPLALLMSTGLFTLSSCLHYINNKISISKVYLFAILPTLAVSTYFADLQPNQPTSGFSHHWPSNWMFFIIGGLNLRRDGIKSHPIRYALSAPFFCATS